MRLVARATEAAWVRWRDGKRVEYRVREAGRLPNREELGHTDTGEWEFDSAGSLYDPWRHTSYLYLVDLKSAAEAFTFVTSSVGGRSAIDDLVAQILVVQRITEHSPKPIVELRATEILTCDGRRSKPVFKIVGWRFGDNDDDYDGGGGGPRIREFAT
jgi:hypothetical protein